MKEEILQYVWSKGNHLFAKQSVQPSQQYILNSIANLFSAGDFYYYIIDFADPSRFEHFSPNTGDLLGIDTKNYKVATMMELIHPEDLELVQHCEGCIGYFMENKISPEEVLNYKFSYQLRVKVKGVYRMVLHQAVTLSIDGFGRLSKVLSVDTLIDHITQVNRKKMSFIGMNGSPSYYSIDPMNPNFQKDSESVILFSPRELEVIHYFADGYTAREVAALLHLAEGTVRTHRRNCLRKSNCPNMTALVALCIREGWI